MGVFEVWRYGYGDQGRLRYRAPAEEDAIKAFLDRFLANGHTFQEHLNERGEEELKICVKDPTKTGTRENPNYPSVRTLGLL